MLVKAGKVPMSTSRFKVSIGAKRQVTLPAEILQKLQIPERGELMVEVIGDHAVITPMVSMPRTELPEELRRTFESRRGPQSSDVPLEKFLHEEGFEGVAAPPISAPARPSAGERLRNVTPNERGVLESVLPKPRLANLTEQEKRVLHQITSRQSPRRIAQTLGLAEPVVKSNLSSIKQKLNQMLEPAADEAGSMGE